MKRKNGRMAAAGTAALLAGTALFKELAPERYGLPEIEVLAPGATGQRVEEGRLRGNSSRPPFSRV